MVEVDEEWSLIGLIFLTLLLVYRFMRFGLTVSLPLMKFNRWTYGKVVVSLKMIAGCLQKWKSVWEQLNTLGLIY